MLWLGMNTVPSHMLEGAMRIDVFARFYEDESGATAIEYGLIAALVSISAMAAMEGLGVSLDTMFTEVANKLLNAVN